MHFKKPYYIINLVVTENVTQTIEDARLAQLVEHLTLNQGVQGSNPWRRTQGALFLGCMGPGAVFFFVV